MIKKVRVLITFIIFVFVFEPLQSSESFFNQAEKKYNQKKYEESKFLLQRNIVFNPKDVKSYLYLAKIYRLEKNQKKEEKNLDTVLLLEPSNEEAIYMLLEIDLKKSNYTRVKKSLETFLKVCKNLCEKEKSIKESLKNLEPNNES